MPESSAKRESYYDTLGVTRTATPDEVEVAFRDLARKWHPDVCADAQPAAENFKLIAEAYEVLGDPVKRRQYDEAEGRRRVRIKVPVMHRRKTPATIDPAGIQGGRFRPVETLGGSDSLLESLSAQQWRRRVPNAAHVRKELDVTAELCVTPEEARRGGVVEFTLRTDATCPRCKGQESDCSACGGSGIGRPRSRTMSVKIPAGVRTGSVLRLPREGRRLAGMGLPGDLILTIQIKPCW